jgi:hypothetical protein
MEQKEHILIEPGTEDERLCLCGNTSSDSGFFSCDNDGNEVEPTAKDWTTNWLACGRCGRMLDIDTLEVVGRNENAKTLI